MKIISCLLLCSRCVYFFSVSLCVCRAKSVPQNGVQLQLFNKKKVKTKKSNNKKDERKKMNFHIPKVFTSLFSFACGGHWEELMALHLYIHINGMYVVLCTVNQFYVNVPQVCPLGDCLKGTKWLASFFVSFKLFL